MKTINVTFCNYSTLTNSRFSLFYFSFFICSFFIIFFFCNNSFAQKSDTLSFKKYPFINEKLNIIENDSNSIRIFYQKLYDLQQLKSGRVDIVHIGDSHIQADHFSGTIRQKLQLKFGNAGRGLLFPYHIAKSNEPGSFKTSSNRSWDSKRNVFYEKPLPIGVCGFTIETTDSIATINLLVKDQPNAAKSIEATFQCKTTIDIFGFSLESDSGVFVDNFSFRGNSGMPINKVSQSVYAETNNCLGYDLIILEYGLNAVNEKITDFLWYERGMNNVIKHIQASFPTASILLISVGDKGYSRDGVYETDPSVPILVETQKRMAKNNNIAFWSLYDAMGGNGSMVKWVEGDTILANKDYTHFNFRGAHKAGKLLFDKLMNEYQKFNKNNFVLNP